LVTIARARGCRPSGVSILILSVTATAASTQPTIPQRAIDPRRCNISCDANALDRDGTTNDQLVERYSAPSGFLKIIRVFGEHHQWQAATKKISSVTSEPICTILC